MSRLLLSCCGLIVLVSVSVVGQSSSSTPPTRASYDIDFIGPPLADRVMQQAKETYVVFGCAYCHDVTLTPRGEATDLTRSALVGSDTNGDRIVALLRAGKPLEHLAGDNADQKVGIGIVRKALQTPARQIVRNAGADESVVVGKILDDASYAFGYNAQTGEYGDLVSQGVIDPTKVVRCALQDAASIAGLLITTEAMVAERPREATPPMPGGGGMGGMGGMDF